jgi:hypothetical protein
MKKPGIIIFNFFWHKIKVILNFIPLKIICQMKKNFLK